MTTEENAQGIQINSVLSVKDLEYIRQHVLDCIKKITSKKLRVLSLSFFLVQKEFLLESFFFW